MSTVGHQDYYEALGVARDATAAAIKTAYRRLVLKHHPDKVGDDEDKTAAADRFHKIQTAWEAVGDEEKRSRYDAQCRLASLRREKELSERSRFSAPDYSRPSAYRTPTDLRPPHHSPVSPRAPPPRSYSYRAVEVEPPFDQEYDRPRPSDHDADRRRRSLPKDERQRSKLDRQDSKDSERLRYREKGRQHTKATNRDRDMKHSYSRPEATTDSDSDHYFERRPARDTAAEARERERYLDLARRQAEEARSNQYMDERTQQIFSDARDYQQRMRSSRGHTEARRPSPTRMSSSRDHIEYAKTADGRPAAVRRGSARPRTSSRDDTDMRGSRRGSDRDNHRSSAEYDEPRRPPTLNQTKSAPQNIHIPLEKQRSNSVQHHPTLMEDFVPPPVRRADSMPHAAQQERSKPSRSSTLRQIQTNDAYERRSPTRGYTSSSRSPKDYSDEHLTPTRDPYRTEVREPVSRKMTRSPSPVRAAEKSRSASSRQAPQMPPRTTSTSYNYPAPSDLPSRPKLSRGNSGRNDSYLFGEVPTTGSGRDREPYSASAAENVRVREMRPDVKVSTGYTSSRRPSADRSPSYYRTSSYNSPTVSA